MQCIYTEVNHSNIHNKLFQSYDTKRTCSVSFCISIDLFMNIDYSNMSLYIGEKIRS